MRFVKAHGAGNDFVLLEDLDDRLAMTPEFVAAVCDRHFGVGADGLIRITRARAADFFMDYYNADGATAEMCGNGIRTLAKYVADRAIHPGARMRVDTRGGMKQLELSIGPDGKCHRVRVDMGEPVLDAAQIPTTLAEPQRATVHGFDAAAVSMGNPHCVVFVESLERSSFETDAPSIEADTSTFPARANVEFVEVLNDHEVRMRVFERGVGETLACGTGACAVGVASALRGFTQRSVAVHLPGGTLDIEWADDNRVYMTGPAEETFEGELSASLAAMILQNAKG